MKTTKKLLSVLMALVMMFSFAVSTYAAEPIDDLKSDVYGEIAGNEYDKEGGGHLTGDEVLVMDSTEFVFEEDSFNQLTSSAQTEIIQDIKAASDNSVKNNDNVSEGTVQMWFKELQAIDGVGSKLMTTILANTKPDFVTANTLYEPFSGVIGTILGLLSVLLMAFLGIVMVLDISYIALPPMRMLVSDNGDRGRDGKGNSLKSNLISNDAIYAVKMAEDKNDGDGGKRQALGVYLKRRITMLILLGVCLLYLVQGQIYTLVGWILDLVSGFLGF